MIQRKTNTPTWNELMRKVMKTQRELPGVYYFTVGRHFILLISVDPQPPKSPMKKWSLVLLYI